MLIGSLPEVGVRFAERKLRGIPGRPPSLLDPPAGCRFRDRCPLAFEKCVEQPPYVDVAPGHQVACWAVAAEAMLKLDRVSKIYRTGTFGGKELHAVANVSFEVQPGEVVSLIGESGSGKSTIGRMILRLARITSGSIGFDGVDISTLKRRG